MEELLLEIKEEDGLNTSTPISTAF